jgi:hypothetical protein
MARRSRKSKAGGKRRQPGRSPKRPEKEAVVRPVETHLDRRPPTGARARDVAATRELFWQNVMREILTNLSMVSGRKQEPGAAAPPPEPAGADTGDNKALATKSDADAAEEMELFDGRLAIITRQGQRVPIAEVFPLFACGIANPADRALSMEVECTVFQIRTPGGEVFTLPLEEMRTFHALTPELMRRLERSAQRQAKRRGASPDEERLPFGFAAFTSLARGGPSIVPEAPTEPME